MVWKLLDPTEQKKWGGADVPVPSLPQISGGSNLCPVLGPGSTHLPLEAEGFQAFSWDTRAEFRGPWCHLCSAQGYRGWQQAQARAGQPGVGWVGAVLGLPAGVKLECSL